MRDFLEDFPTVQEQAALKIICENSLKAFIKVMHYLQPVHILLLNHFTMKLLKNWKQLQNIKQLKIFCLISPLALVNLKL